MLKRIYEQKLIGTGEYKIRITIAMKDEGLGYKNEAYVDSINIYR